MPRLQGALLLMLPGLESIQCALTPVCLRSILIQFSHPRLGFPRDISPVGLPVKILNAFLSSSNVATCPAHPNHPNYIRGKVKTLKFFIVKPSPFWAQILASLPCFQISLAFIPLLI